MNILGQHVVVYVPCKYFHIMQIMCAIDTQSHASEWLSINIPHHDPPAHAAVSPSQEYDIHIVYIPHETIHISFTLVERFTIFVRVFCISFWDCLELLFPPFCIHCACSCIKHKMANVTLKRRIQILWELYYFLNSAFFYVRC